MQRSDGLPSHKYVRIDGEMEWVEVEDLSETARGESGFGSTGR